MRFLVLSLFLMATAITQTQAAETKAKSPWGALAILSYEPWMVPSGKYDMDGQRINTYFGVSYKLTANDKVDILHRMEHKNSPEDNDASYDWVRTNFNYKRLNLLTEDKHGVKMGFHYRLRYYGTNTQRVTNFRMYNRVGLNFSKSLTDKFSANLSTYFAKFDSEVSNKVGSLSTYFYVPFGFDYKLNDKVSFGALFEYITFHNHEALNDDSFDITLATNYQAHEKITLSFNLYKAGIMKNKDDKLIAEDTLKGVEYSIDAVFILF